MKSIASEVHMLSVVQSEFYEATRILFVRKENKSASMQGCRRVYTACVRWVISKICVQKVFLSLHKNQIEPLMADGLPWRCLSCFSGPQQWYLLGSQWDSKKPPVFYLKYLKLCSEDEQSFYGVGTTCR